MMKVHSLVALCQFSAGKEKPFVKRAVFAGSRLL